MGVTPIKKNGPKAVSSCAQISLNRLALDSESLSLWSLDFLVLDLTSTVVRGAFAVVCFFNFVAWFGHDILVESKFHVGSETPTEQVAFGVAIE